jgi:hypothetical protein
MENIHASYTFIKFRIFHKKGNLRYLSKASASVLSGVQNTEKRMKARDRRPSDFIVLKLVF